MADNLYNPAVLAMPFANNGDKNQIPNAPTGSNLASLSEGFPLITETLPSKGGEPPVREDFNGIMNLNSQFYFYNQNGGLYTFRQDVSDAIGGYPNNAALWYKSPEGLTLLRSTKDNNTDNFVENPAVIGTTWTREIPSIVDVKELLAHKADIDLANTGMISNAILAAPNGVIGTSKSTPYYELQENINGTWGEFLETDTGISFNQVRGPQNTLDMSNSWVLKTRILATSSRASGRIRLLDSSGKARVHLTTSFVLDSGVTKLATIVFIYTSNTATFEMPIALVPANGTEQGVYDIVLGWDRNTYTLTVTGIDGQQNTVSTANLNSVYLSGDAALYWGENTSRNASVQYGEAYSNLSVNSVNYINYGLGTSITVKKDVLGLASDGRNMNNLLQSIKYTVPSDIILSEVPVLDGNYVVFMGTDNGIRCYQTSQYYIQNIPPSSQLGLWYSPAENLFREYINSAWTKVNLFQVASYTAKEAEIAQIKAFEPFSIAINDKANIDLSNCPAGYDYVVETYQNGTSWYRKYKSGWVEQGGFTQSDGGQSWRVQNFLVPFLNKNYTITISDNQLKDGSAGNAGAVINLLLSSPTQFNWFWPASTNFGITYYACGQGA